jgi:hypothetical protein
MLGEGSEWVNERFREGRTGDWKRKEERETGREKMFRYAGWAVWVCWVRDGRIEGWEIGEEREERRKRGKKVYERERERERGNVLVCRVSSLGMLGEGGDRKKEKTWDKDREGERIIWSCWVNS